jgi:ATP-dependent DNA helicase RecQ
MAYLQNALDDLETAECSRCSVCRGGPVVSIQVDRRLAIAARQFLKQVEMPFKPKKQVARVAFEVYGFSRYFAVCPPGIGRSYPIALGDAGWGGLVANDKHAGYFRDELVEAVAEMIEQRWQPEPALEWITCVLSRNHPKLVSAFALRLANRLGLPSVEAIYKVIDNEPQKIQQNRFHQCKNLDGVFKILENIPAAPVLLVDDVIDSGWTMTVLAALLRKAGSGLVYLVALALTSSGD